MMGVNFKDVIDNPAKRLSDSPLGKLVENFTTTLTENYDSSLAKDEKDKVETENTETRELTDDEKQQKKQDNGIINESDNSEKNVEKILEEYIDDLKEKSECPETIPDKPFDSSDLKQLSPERNAEMRDEFDEKKAELKKQWEEENGRPWPKYDHDVYSSNGKLIRKAGNDYDAHHIQPLGMGGKNEAKNITPLSAENHYDKQGVHSPDSPYSKLNEMLGGNSNE